MDRGVRMIVKWKHPGFAAEELMMVHRALSPEEIAALVKVIVDAGDALRAALALEATHRRYDRSDLYRLKLMRNSLGMPPDKKLRLVK